jgi:hypothetical protein
MTSRGTASDRRNPFIDGMERLDLVVRSVKTQQIQERQGPIQVASNRMNAISPDELWARQFSNQCIGPVCFGPAPKVDMPLPLANVMQSFSAARQTAYAAPPAAPGEPASGAKRTVAVSEPIGIAIGKKVRRRGIFGRLFGRR